MQCKSCPEDNPLSFYKYRPYECKPCFRLRIAAAKVKPPSCKCGEVDPKKFYKRTPYTCKACARLVSIRYNDEIEADRERRLAKNAYNLAYQKANLFRYRHNAAARRAAHRGMDCDITVDFLKALYAKQDGKCFYSGISFDVDSRSYTWSIDRTDSSKGYTQDNVVLVTHIVNCMKNDLPVAEFLEVARRVVSNSHK